MGNPFDISKVSDKGWAIVGVVAIGYGIYETVSTAYKFGKIVVKSVKQAVAEVEEQEKEQGNNS